MSDLSNSHPRFTAQAPSAEDILKDQTVGLVQLDDFRKRRREVEGRRSHGSGAATPTTDASDADTGPNLNKKKKRKTVGRKLLSFDDDGEGEGQGPTTRAQAPISNMQTVKEDLQTDVKRKIKSNPNAGVPAPRAMTKAYLAAEAAERERLRSEFIDAQNEVRDAEISIPFVFYDGSNVPGGAVKVKKGEQIWLFLEKCRKLGAEIGVGSEGNIEIRGSKQRADSKKSWARIGVDDLMLIRGSVIIPHHYEFYYFIVNKIPDPSQPGKLLFDYNAAPTTRKEKASTPLLRRPGDENIEGRDDDPSYTKIVDRRWYQKNKHIYPASLWREFKVGKEYEELLKGRRDTQGNTFFFS